MPFTSRTYSCGSLGRVRKLLNLNHGQSNWVNIPVPQATAQNLLDIETDPNNGDKVFVVGEADVITPTNFYGVAVSSNGGTTWNLPGGNYQSAVLANTSQGLTFKWNEIIVVSSTLSFIVGSVNLITRFATIAVSTDGGANYNIINWHISCTPNPTTAGLSDVEAFSVHFPNANIGVVGLNNFVIKTTDGGGTWTIMNGGLPLSTSVSPNPPGTPLLIGDITGIHIRANEEVVTGVGRDFIIITDPVISGSPGGMTVDSWRNNFITNNGPGTPPVNSGFTPNLSIGYHLGGMQPPTDNVIWVSGDALLGIHSKDHGIISWTISPFPGWNPSGSISRRAAHFYKQTTGLPVALEGFYNKSTGATNQVYHNIQGFSPGLEVLSDSGPGLNYSPNAIWTWYQETPDPICYTLTDCEYGTTVHTTVNLSAYLNKVIQVSEFPERCFLVTEGCSVPNTPQTVTYVADFIDCDTCTSPPSRCYELVDCNGRPPFCLTCQPPIITNTDLSLYNGQVVVLGTYPEVCWVVNETLNCAGATPLNTTIINYIDCETCASAYLPQCYTLTDCQGLVANILTNTDLSLYLGGVINIEGSNTCWQVSLAQACQGSISVVVTNSFANCAACLPVCYLIANCQDPGDIKITNTNLSLYLGKVIKIDGCPDTCWIVSLSPDCNGAVPITLQDSYIDCDACLNIQPPPPLKLRPRMIKPGYTTPGCSPQYTEKVNCTFAKAAYDQMAIARYGITLCCNEPIEKWDIKKQLLDLRAIYDPELCKPVECCPPCAVVASIKVYYPVLPICPPPTNVIAVLNIPVPVCSPPTNVQAGIIINPTQPCICYLITVNIGASCNFEYTNCFGVPQNVLALPGINYICSITLPTTTCLPGNYTIQTTPGDCLLGTCGAP